MKRKRKIRTYLAELLVFCICMGLFSGYVMHFFLGFFAGYNDVTIEYARERYDVISTIMGFATTAIIILIGILIYNRLRRNVTDPIERLASGMEEVSQGNLQIRISVNSKFEMQQMEESFNCMVEELEKTEQIKNEQKQKEQLLYASLAHDLKTPMTMIMGYAKLLGIKEEVSEEERKKYLDTIVEQTAHANELLDSMLSYSKLNNSEYEFKMEKNDLAECLRESVADCYSAFEEAAMDMELCIPEEYIAFNFDVVEMKRVFHNLLWNIVKHTPKNTSCMVLLECKEEGMEIVFADNGPKIAVEFQENLFDTFMVGDESRNTKHGSGLGLSISKKIIERHNGTITYTDNWKDEYKAFVITLKR